MGTPVLRQRRGSDRATASVMSCKLPRTGNRLSATWLDSPSRPVADSRLETGPGPDPRV